MAGDSGLMRARAPRGQMQLHALTGSHQEEAAVNSNSLRMVMELTVFVGRGRGDKREEYRKASEWGGWTKVIKSQKAAQHLSALARFPYSFLLGEFHQ